MKQQWSLKKSFKHVTSAPAAKFKVWANCIVCVSFDQAKAHIHTYLKNLEEKLLDKEDHTELYLLFVNCFQVKQETLLPLWCSVKFSPVLLMQ